MYHFILCELKWNSWQLIRANSYPTQTIAGPQTSPQTPFPNRPWWWCQWWCFCCCPTCGPGCYWKHSPLPVWLLCYVPSKLSLCPHSSLPLASVESLLILTLRSLKTKTESLSYTKNNFWNFNWYSVKKTPKKSILRTSNSDSLCQMHFVISNKVHVIKLPY